MSFWKLFGGKESPRPTKGGGNAHISEKAPSPQPSTTSDPQPGPASEFAMCAARGSAWSRLPIRSIPQVITELNAAMERLNIPSDAFYDLYNNSLLGVCVECNEYCAGKAFLRMPLFAAAGDRLSFTGNSGGFERMMQGTCLNYSCTSTEFDLFLVSRP